MSQKQLRLVLVGKTGSGKSKTGNTILNGVRHFEASSQGSSVTAVCQMRDDVVQGRQTIIVDTPGLVDTHRVEEDVLQEITRCIYMSAPGPHAIILVVQIGRFTAEDVATVDKFVKHFGDALFKYIIIAFTRYDDYKRDMDDKGISDFSIKDYTKTLPPGVKEFINGKCDGRVVGFDNTLRGEMANLQVKNLFNEIDIMLRVNGQSFYTNEDFEMAEKQQRKEMEEQKEALQKKLEEETRKRQEEIEKAASEKAKEQIRKEMEQFKADIGKQMEEENLRKTVKNSESGFETFKSIASVMATVLPHVAKALKYFKRI